MAVGEWDQRQLCPDGGCVGVIGADGTCKVCGRAAPNWGDERTRGLNPPEDGAADHDEDDDDDDGDDGDAGDRDAGDRDAGDGDAGDRGDAVAASSSPEGWAERRLCPDGACIGLLGPDGKCKVCGRAASGTEPTAAPDPGAMDATASAPAEPPGSAGEGTTAEPAPAEPASVEPVTAEPAPAEPAPAGPDAVVP
jgi:hypothetical protein